MAKRVYFAFHYQDVVDFRANVVRNHKLTTGVESAGYYDHSIWEETKRTGAAAMKEMIDDELENTSVTVVLIGSETWYRRWVRYEIMKSIERGNRVLGIHINGIAGKDRKTKELGPNPFDNLGLQISDDLKTGKPTEWGSEGKWIWFSDLGPFPITEQPTENKGIHFTLRKWCAAYDWVVDKGFDNFSKWIE
jgi:MTH538 TIR-like domain (DUF1863)